MLALCTSSGLVTEQQGDTVAGVRRLIIVEPESRRVEGIVSLSDLAAYLFL